MVKPHRGIAANALGLFLAGMLAFGSATASGAVVDGAGALDPILAAIMQSLDVKGIDVVRGDTAKVPVGSRPRVARLSGMDGGPTHVHVGATPWMAKFLSGAIGFVGAVKSDGAGAAAATRGEFLAKWDAAPTEKRVFLSFTAADRGVAEAVAAALHDEEYVTFTFLNSGSVEPRYDAGTAGAIFAKAGHHFVVDTKNARESAGVRFEALLLPSVSHPSAPPGHPGPGPDAPLGSPDPPSRGAGLRLAEPGVSRSEVADALNGSDAPNRTASSIADLLHGLRQEHWVVTRNWAQPNKLFVHSGKVGTFLFDPRYLIEVESNGLWIVYEPVETIAGLEYGRLVGNMFPEPGVDIGACGCK
jgi:hypothetical protein